MNRLNYDTCTYQHNLKQSIGPGEYVVGAPRVECLSCFNPDPRTTITGPNSFGNSIDRPLVDIDSELIGINRKASNCPLDKYIPQTKPYATLSKIRDCRSTSTEDTRLSNPPCTLRDSGWNRWEWLCNNPQDKALITFDYIINNRTIVKDNHRPCIPTPINQYQLLPPANDSDDVVRFDQKQCNNVMQNAIPSTSWRKTNSYNNYL